MKTFNKSHFLTLPNSASAQLDKPLLEVGIFNMEKEVKDYPNYLIYDDGRIWSKRTSMFLKAQILETHLITEDETKFKMFIFTTSLHRVCLQIPEMLSDSSKCKLSMISYEELAVLTQIKSILKQYYKINVYKK